MMVWVQLQVVCARLLRRPVLLVVGDMERMLPVVSVWGIVYQLCIGGGFHLCRDWALK